MMVDLNRRAQVPFHDQIRTQLRQLVQRGILPPDARLPGTREMARLLGVSRNTVIRAYDDLVADGCLKVVARKGVFVDGDHWPRTAPAGDENTPVVQDDSNAPPDLIRFTGEPVLGDESWVERLRGSFRDVLAREGSRLLGYGSPEGYPPFREFLVDRLRRHGISSACTEGVLVVNGFQEALSLLAQTLLEPGDAVFTEDPTHPAALDVLRYFGARVVGIPLDREGMRVDLLEARLERVRPRFLYTIPTHHNPTGVTLSHSRRQKLLELCARHGLLIVEALFSDELLCGGCFVVPLQAMADAGGVVSIGTFSKVICPALRVGWVAGLPALVRRLTRVKAVTDSFTNTVSQAAIVEYASQGHLDQQLAIARRAYRARRDRLAAMLPHALPPGSRWELTEAHLSVWIRLPASASGRAVSNAVATGRYGVAFREGPRHFVDGRGGNYLGLSVMSALSSQIPVGLERLAAYLREEYLAEPAPVDGEPGPPGPGPPDVDPCHALVVGAKPNR